jgi:N-acyl amino acid synthase of PEP-CTERM/exosortase system
VAEVVEQTRRGSPEHFAADGAQGLVGRNPFQSIVLGLISALFQMSAACGIDHWYALMEPSLARHLSRLGLRFTSVGPLVNHRGKRQPMLASLWHLRQDILDKNPLLHELIEFNGEPVVQCTRRAVRLDWSQRIFTSPPFSTAVLQPG